MAVSDRTQDAADRADVALQATWQIESLFNALLDQGVGLLDGGEMLHASTVIRALALRGRALSRSAMSMLGDNLATVEEAQRVVDACEARVTDDGGASHE